MISSEFILEVLSTTIGIIIGIVIIGLSIVAYEKTVRFVKYLKKMDEEV